jgi:DNA-binding NtrC family response regulator
MNVKTNPRKTILCVDDDQTVLTSLKDQLKSYYKDRYNYEVASDAKDALKILKMLHKEKIHIFLIISDWLLVNMKGDELLIRVHQQYPTISTVLLTGHASLEAIENAKKNANLLTCLNKPWSLEDLVHVIDLADKK